MNKRIVCLILALLLALGAALPALAAESSTVNISDSDDLLSLAKKCSLDSWSRGKTVILDADIDLNGVDFTGIPIFSGTFDGRGHTIYGLEQTGVSGRGLFNIVNSGAVIRNLSVVGMIAPTGSQTYIGGIAGENNGSISGCTFSGAVSGGTGVGGIVGKNCETGTIYSCQSYGTIDGSLRTGGIAGENAGTVSQSVNHSSVNTSNEEKSQTLEDLELSISMDLSGAYSGSALQSSTDVGGVTGYSTGLILSCVNRGNVGYPHIGYNIGGIAGRSSGVISGCVNQGTLNGRKDVGGIAGQMEPYLILNIDENTIDKITEQLNEMNATVNSALDNLSDNSSTLRSRLESISAYLGNAIDDAHSLGGYVSDYADHAISEFDRASSVLSDVANQLADITEQLPDFSDDLSDGVGRLEDAMDDFSDAGDISSDAISQLKDAVDELGEASRLLTDGMNKIQTGLSELKKAINVDEDAARAALEKIQTGIDEVSEASSRFSAALDEIITILRDEGAITDEVVAAAGRAEDALSDMSDGLGQASDGISDILGSASIDWDAVSNASDYIKDGLDSIVASGGKLTNALNDIKRAISGLDGVSDALGRGLDGVADAMGSFGSAVDRMTGISDDIYSLMRYLSGIDPIQLGQPDDNIRDTGDSLYSSVSAMNGQMDGLNDDLSGVSDTTVSDIRRLSDQAKELMDTVTGMIDDRTNLDVDDIYTDTSDADIDSAFGGKVYRCQNSGSINGDLNVGGITGLMAIEYDYDPEDDVLQSDSSVLNRRYETKAVVLECKNYGSVTAKKNYAGAVAGRMVLGYMTRSEGYGSVTSEGGDYVGGVVGGSDSKLRRCYSKATLSGRDYVGGIAGYADEVMDCVSLVDIVDSASFVGTICGNADADAEGNVFVSDDFAAMDGVSYAGKAEPVEYSELITRAGLPGDFKSFVLTFTIDDEPVKTVTFDYGDSFDDSVFPEIPPREGYCGHWDAPRLDELHFDVTIPIVYEKTVTALTGTLLRDEKQPAVIAEGIFSELDELDAELLAFGSDFQRLDSNAYSKTVSAETMRNPMREAIAESCELWSISIPDDGQEKHIVRIRPLNGDAEHTAIYVSYDGKSWKRAATEEIGSYAAFSIDGCRATVAVVPTETDARSICATVIPPVLVLALAVFIVIKIKRSRKKKRSGKHVSGAK